MLCGLWRGCIISHVEGVCDGFGGFVPKIGKRGIGGRRRCWWMVLCLCCLGWWRLRSGGLGWGRRWVSRGWELWWPGRTRLRDFSFNYLPCS